MAVYTQKYSVIGIGGDYGQQNATTYQACGINGYSCMLEGLKEYYHSGRESGKQKSPSEYAQDFTDFVEMLSEKYGCRIFYLFLDPSARGLQEEIRRACRQKVIAVHFKDAENDVALGISRVQKLLTYGILSVSPEQEHLVKEFGLYEYDKKLLDKGKEVPVKDHDHCLDALRYLVLGFWNRVKWFLPKEEREEEVEIEFI